jgi:hypothetical protein
METQPNYLNSLIFLYSNSYIMKETTVQTLVLACITLFAIGYGLYMNQQKKKQSSMVPNPTDSNPLYHSDYQPSSSSKGPSYTKTTATYGENQPTVQAADLLPKDTNSAWGNMNPQGQGEFKNINMLNAGSLIGINTVSGSLRNANLQLRSEPPNPHVDVGPWNQSTIVNDISHRPLEIGQGPM